MLSVILIGISLSMDAFAVSVTNGIAMRPFKTGYALWHGLYFGAFQFLMPLAGYILGSTVSGYVTIAAGGFRDITRIASSSPIMWEQICVENNQNISNVLDDYIRLLVQIKCFVDNKDSKSLYQMFANSRDYRDSIDVVDNGLLKKAYVLYLDIADEAGGIATIATILAMEKISIKNIGIIHNREFEEGVLKIEFYDGTSMEKGAALLKKRNYIVYER